MFIQLLAVFTATVFETSHTGGIIFAIFLLFCLFRPSSAFDPETCSTPLSSFLLLWFAGLRPLVCWSVGEFLLNLLVVKAFPL